MGQLERDCWEVHLHHLPAIVQRLEGEFVQVRANDKDASLLDGFPLYWVDKGKKESKRPLSFLEEGGGRQYNIPYHHLDILRVL